MIDPKQIEEYRALVERLSPFNPANDALPVPELRQRVTDAAPDLWRAASALLGDRGELGRLALAMSRGYGAPGLVTCRKCGKVASIASLRICEAPESFAHFAGCPVAPWEDGKP